jgi:hypothetical protein
LVKAAGLETRGHQEEVATCFDAMREAMVVADFHRHFLRVAFLKQLESALKG